MLLIAADVNSPGVIVRWSGNRFLYVIGSMTSSVGRQKTLNDCVYGLHVAARELEMRLLFNLLNVEVDINAYGSPLQLTNHMGSTCQVATQQR